MYSYNSYLYGIGGIPTIIFSILLEMKGLDTYAYALNILITSIIELIKFIFYIFIASDIKLNLKNIPKMFKFLFNKKKKEII